MKMIDLDAVHRSLTEDVFPITVEADIMDGARQSLERMMAVPRDN
jgi:quinolinate synthase